MGWNSGGEIFSEMARAIKKADMEAEKVIPVLKDLIRILEEGDCDVLDESFGISPEADQALTEAGYHNYKQGTCKELDRYGEICSCGWKSRWA